MVPLRAITSTLRGSKRLWLIKPFVTSILNSRVCATACCNIAGASVSKARFGCLLNADISPLARNSRTVLSASSSLEINIFFILSYKPRLLPLMRDTLSISFILTSISARSPGERTKDLTDLAFGKKPKSCAISSIS